MAFEDAVNKQESIQDNIQDTKLEKIYNEFTEESKRITQATMSAFQKYWTQIFMAISSFLLIGIQQFAQPEFDPLFFSKAQFWYDYVPFVTAQWLILFSKVTGDIKYLSEISNRSVNLQNDIQEHVDKDKRTPYIFVGAKLEDTDRKSRAFRRKISRIIEKKIKKYNFGTFANLQVFCENKATYDKVRFYKIGSRREQRLRKRLIGLLNKITHEYIVENIENIKVKYIQVNETALMSGFQPRNDETHESDFQEHTSKAIVSEFGSGQVMSMIIGAIVLSLGLSPKDPTMVTIIFFVFKAFFLLWAYVKGSARSKTIFQRTTIKALQERNDMLNRIERRVLG